MVRIGDRVYHFLDMKNIGTILDIKLKGSNIHLEGGTSQSKIVLVVRLDDGRVVEMNRDDVLRVD
jgi:hypothetical protein